MEKELAVGKITATHGLRGDVRIVSFSGEYAHLSELSRIDLLFKGQRNSYEIETVKSAGKKIVVKLKGVNTIESAELLIGAELWVSREHAAPLKEDEYYFADICGCSVVYDGQEYGTVVSVCPGGQNELLEIKRKEGENIFVPFLEVFIGTVDIEQKRIEILEDWFFT